jgi:aryl-alcohol dehydrogenase-like predicted oxidoreductase
MKSTPMKQRVIGDLTVSAIGLGAMPLSIAGHPDEEQAIRTIHAALDVGVTLIDTADSYRPDIHDPSGNGHNERLIAKAISRYRGATSALRIATKTGNVKPRAGEDWIVNAAPAYIRQQCDLSLRALQIERIDLYQLHRPDPNVPFEESVGAMMDLQDAGKIHMIGLSNVDIRLIELARLTLGRRRLASVQNQYSPAVRKSEDVLAYCMQSGISFLPWSPLGGVGLAGRLGAMEPFANIAKKHGASPQQIALAWHLAKGERVIAIPGARRPETILDSARSVDIVLSSEDFKVLDQAILNATC